MIELTEAQVWTLMAAFAGSIFAMMGMTLRVMRTEIRTVHSRIDGLEGTVDAQIGGLRGEMNAQIGGLRGEMNAQISGLRGEMNAQISGLRGEMNARFERVDTTLAHLDRDVEALVKAVFPERD